LKEEIDKVESKLFYGGNIDEHNSEKEELFEVLKDLSTNYIFLKTKIQEHKAPVLLLENKKERLINILERLKVRGAYKLSKSEEYIKQYENEIEKVQDKLDDYYYNEILEIELLDI